MKKLDYLSTLFVGIDIGARQNVVSAINFDQEFLIKMTALTLLLLLILQELAEFILNPGGVLNTLLCKDLQGTDFIL